MKAAVLTATDTIEISDVERPQPQAGEVLVQVHYTGICGSDVPRVLQGRIHFFPIILGHEFSGTVVEAGKEVDPTYVGRRVSGIPLEPCFDCPDCRAGNYSLCSSYGFVGSRSAGSMAEYVCLPAKNVMFLGDDVSDIEGAFFEPSTVAVHGIELSGFREGGHAIVIGAGTVGILLAQALKGYGAETVVVANRNAKRLETAAKAGLDRLVEVDGEDWAERAYAENDGERFDFVFDTAGTPQTILQSFEVAANKASVMFVGTPSADVSFTSKQWEDINRKELTVRGSWMSYSASWPGIEWTRVNEFFDEGTLQIVPEMIDTVYPLSQTAQAFDRYKNGPKVQGKLLIDSLEADED